MDKAVIFFCIITLINVILSTTKSVLTVRSTKGVATLINAIAYGFYAMVVKQMATVSTEMVVIATVGANLIGVYFSLWLLDKFKKDVLWKISVVPKVGNLKSIKRDLKACGLGFNEYSLSTKYGERFALDIFSESQAESKKIKEILELNGKVKYHVLEIKNQL